MHHGARQQRELPLAAAHAAGFPVRQMRDAETLHRFQRRGPVLRAGRIKNAEPVGEPHHNDFEQRIVKGRNARLRDIGDLARRGAAVQRSHVLAVYEDAPLRRCEKAEYAAEKRALTDAVRPKHGGNIAVGGGEGDIVQHARAAVGKPEAVDLNAHGPHLPAE